jgi:hypothetical protein
MTVAPKTEQRTSKEDPTWLDENGYGGNEEDAQKLAQSRRTVSTHQSVPQNVSPVAPSSEGGELRHIALGEDNPAELAAVVDNARNVAIKIAI